MRRTRQAALFVCLFLSTASVAEDAAEVIDRKKMAAASVVLGYAAGSRGRISVLSGEKAVSEDFEFFKAGQCAYAAAGSRDNNKNFAIITDFAKLSGAYNLTQGIMGGVRFHGRGKVTCFGSAAKHRCLNVFSVTTFNVTQILDNMAYLQRHGCGGEVDPY